MLALRHVHVTSMHQMVTVYHSTIPRSCTHIVACTTGVMLVILNSCSPMTLNTVEFTPPAWAPYLSTTRTLTCCSEHMARVYTLVQTEALQPQAAHGRLWRPALLLDSKRQRARACTTTHETRRSLHRTADTRNVKGCAWTQGRERTRREVNSCKRTHMDAKNSGIMRKDAHGCETHWNCD